jgi:hypothetical protein
MGNLLQAMLFCITDLEFMIMPEHRDCEPDIMAIDSGKGMIK